LVPERLIDDIARAAVPVLLTVTFCDALELPVIVVKLREALLRDTPGDPAGVPPVLDDPLEPHPNEMTATPKAIVAAKVMRKTDRMAHPVFLLNLFRI